VDFYYCLLSSIGYIAEHYGYKPSLIVAGIFMGMSGCVTTVLCVLQYIGKKRAKKNKTDIKLAIITSDNSK